MWALALVGLFSNGSFKRRVFGTLRVAIYACVVFGILAGVAVSRVKAAVNEQAFRLAKDLLPVADLLSGATGLRLNGQLINFSLSVLPDTSVSRVLHRMEENCRQHPGPLAAKMQALAAHLPDNLPRAEALKKLIATAGLTHDERDDQGMVLCFTSDHPITPNMDLNMGDGSDLGALGNLRYVIASPGDAATHEEKLTRVVSLWTEGPFRLESLEPPLTGDAPGSDSLVFPRPPASTRLFSAEAVGASYAVRLYETSQSAATVLAFYDQALSAWSPTTLPGYEHQGRGFIKDAQPLVLNVSESEGKTVVTLTELGVASATTEQGQSGRRGLGLVGQGSEAR